MIPHSLAKEQLHRSPAAGIFRAQALIMPLYPCRYILGDAGIETSIGAHNQIHGPDAGAADAVFLSDMAIAGPRTASRMWH